MSLPLQIAFFFWNYCLLVLANTLLIIVIRKYFDIV